ncbi:MAG: aminodeoxychorismate synthase component I [Myxococcales bacterium]|nr:aminodeoxychorismate synthase component I [Myxococcales bacterium]
MATRPRTLLIDNYDSFTMNLYHLIAAVNGEPPTVVRNDELAWATLADAGFDNIVISPGPGRPDRATDFGVCHDAIRHATVPVLGVCLGHQGIATVYGGAVTHAPMPMHGRRSVVFHDDSPLFAGIPQGFSVVRYHSLTVDPDLPDCLRATAWTPDGVLMGLAHKTLPRFGVQFHPESILTEHGARLLANFRDLTHGHRRATVSVASAPKPPEAAPLGLKLSHRKLAFTGDAEQVFCDLFATAPDAFWLDSSRAEPGLARFSFMGAGGGPHGLRVTFGQARGEVTVVAHGQQQTHREGIYDFLGRELARRRVQADLPFDFDGGFVGYFGYGLKADAGAANRHSDGTPAAAFLLADRLLAFDHQEAQIYLLCLHAPGEIASAETWFDAIEGRLAALAPLPPLQPTGAPVLLWLDRDRAAYLDDIARCLAFIHEGESYELCLTNQLRATPVEDPLALHRILRRINKAPYAAFLRFGDLAIVCSSPERFLRIDRDGQVESKPIKGTRPRGRDAAEDEALRRDLAQSEKDRAENLMIVDLLRNDLGRACAVGSVHVPAMMQVETYETVHQLVSTVRGTLRPGVDAIECVRAAFPGGSMTGAPKLRTMNLLDGLETRARGIYSGAIGYLGLGGAADLNIVIRTLVCTPTSTTIGIGGAIVTLSDAEAEFEETLVKARALVEALLIHARGPVSEAIREQVLAALRKHGRAAF